MATKAKKEPVQDEQAVETNASEEATPKAFEGRLKVEKTGKVIRSELMTEVVSQLVVVTKNDEGEVESRVGTVTISFGETEALNGIFEEGKSLSLKLEA